MFNFNNCLKVFVFVLVFFSFSGSPSYSNFLMGEESMSTSKETPGDRATTTRNYNPLYPPFLRGNFGREFPYNKKGVPPGLSVLKNFAKPCIRRCKNQNETPPKKTQFYRFVVQGDGREASRISLVAQVEKTKQTVIYNANDSKVLKNGESLSHLHFTDNSDGTITDNKTGLCWLKNANCFSSKSWAAALSSTDQLMNGLCGLNGNSSNKDWRLPTIDELISLHQSLSINQSQSSGLPRMSHSFIDDIFVGAQLTGFYWTSNERENNHSHAWYVKFTDGKIDFAVKSANYYVWPVKGPHHNKRN